MPVSLGADGTVHAPTVGALCEALSVNGLPCHRLRLPNGDSAVVAEHGAHLLSWQSAGVEHLYLSPGSMWDRRSAIRGGVPVCWPQFNQRGGLVKHGFARNLPWRVGAVRLQAQRAELDLHLVANAQTLAWWPHDFQVCLTIALFAAGMRLTFTVDNLGEQALAFSGALHSYFRVDEVTQTHLLGLQGRPEWDAVTDVHGQGAAVLGFAGEFDRVYGGEAAPLVVRDGRRSLCITQSQTWAQTVVWNPGAAKCKTLADMPDDGFRYMLCVEAAQVYKPIVLHAGAQWQGWQQFVLADATCP